MVGNQAGSGLTRRQLLQLLGSGLVVGGARDSGALMNMLERAGDAPPPGRVVDMGRRRLGQTDMLLSPMGLGGLLAHYEGVLGHPPAEVKGQIYLRAAELGVNLFDTGYGDEVYIPDQLKGNGNGLYFSLKVGAPKSWELEGKVDKHLKSLHRDAVDILRVFRYAYVGDKSLADKIAQLKQAGKVRSLCLIRHHLADQQAYAHNGPEADADADLVIYNYVARGQEPGIQQSGAAGKGVLVMKALGGQYVSWGDKVRTDWTQASETTVQRLAVRQITGEELDIVYGFTSGPWRELADPEVPVPRTSAAVKWVLLNSNVSSVFVAVASVEELEEALGLYDPLPGTSVTPGSWGGVKAGRALAP